MKTIVKIIVLLIISNSIYAASIIKIQLENKTPKYLHITEMYVGPTFYYEEVIDEYNAGYKFRIIITSSEIYTTVYLDMISIDIAGGISKQLWSKKMNLDCLYDEYSFSQESDPISKICWITNNCFTFDISGMKFKTTINLVDVSYIIAVPIPKENEMDE